MTWYAKISPTPIENIDTSALTSLARNHRTHAWLRAAVVEVALAVDRRWGVQLYEQVRQVTLGESRGFLVRALLVEALLREDSTRRMAEREIEQVEEPSEYVRARTVRALAVLKDPMKHLERYAGDESAIVRTEVVRAAERVGLAVSAFASEAVALLTHLSRDQDDLPVIAACDALPRLCALEEVTAGKRAEAEGGWEIVLRIEDLDGPRIKAGASEEAIDILNWLGIDWDIGPLYQLADLGPYEAALDTLAQSGEIYPCRCTRKEIEAASLSAPQQGDHELRYPGTCRPAAVESRPICDDPEGEVAWRMRAPLGLTSFSDAFAGAQQFDIQQTVGDFLVRTKVGLPGYQLAVVVDDSRQGIDQVVRGDDLLPSTARQLLLYERLELGTPPTYTHLPMVIGKDGRRLAKRHGDSRLAYYREQGTSAERVIGLLAEWSGCGTRRGMTARQFLEHFDIRQMSPESIVFTPADDAWLRE